MWVCQPGQPGLEPRSPDPPFTCTSPAAGRNDDIPHRFRPGQTVLTSGHRSGNSVSLVLVRTRGHALRAEGCQSLPTPGRAGPRTSLAMPASPQGRRKTSMTSTSRAASASNRASPPGSSRSTRPPGHAVHRASSGCRRLTWRAGARRREQPARRASQQRGLSIATTAGRFSMTMATTCLHVMWFWRTRTRRSSMTATSKPFRFPPTSTPTHTATRQSMPTPVPLAL
jgi:hypothetical protein